MLGAILIGAVHNGLVFAACLAWVGLKTPCSIAAGCSLALRPEGLGVRPAIKSRLGLEREDAGS